jgi:hypothetical protein
VATPEAEQIVRLEYGQDYGPADRPIMRPYMAGAVLPRPGAGNRSRRLLKVFRPVLWAVGIAMIVGITGAALDVGRDRVIRAFPRAARIYAAAGLAGSPSAKFAVCGRNGAPASAAALPADCDDGRSTAGTK